MNTVIKEPKPRSFLTTLLPFFVLAHCAHHLLTALPAPMMPFIQEDLGLSIIIPPLKAWHKKGEEVHRLLEEKGFLPKGIVAEAKAIK